MEKPSQSHMKIEPDVFSFPREPCKLFCLVARKSNRGGYEPVHFTYISNSYTEYISVL